MTRGDIARDITVYPKKFAHGFVVLCFVVVIQSFILNSHEVFIHIHQVCFAGTGTIVRLPQCQWSKPDGYGKISQCITTTKHSKAKTVCIFLGIYCTTQMPMKTTGQIMLVILFMYCYINVYHITVTWNEFSCGLSARQICSSEICQQSSLALFTYSFKNEYYIERLGASRNKMPVSKTQWSYASFKR